MQEEHTSPSDGNCGSKRIPDDGRFRLASSRAHFPGWLYFDRLPAAGGYYTLTDACFGPDGYQQFTMAAVRTMQFECPGRGDCYFPG